MEQLRTADKEPCVASWGPLRWNMTSARAQSSQDEPIACRGSKARYRSGFVKETP